MARKIITIIVLVAALGAIAWGIDRLVRPTVAQGVGSAIIK